MRPHRQKELVNKSQNPENGFSRRGDSQMQRAYIYIHISTDLSQRRACGTTLSIYHHNHLAATPSCCHTGMPPHCYATIPSYTQTSSLPFTTPPYHHRLKHRPMSPDPGIVVLELPALQYEGHRTQGTCPWQQTLHNPLPLVP